MKTCRLSYDLCRDLIIEIFTWLPVKSLLRFRSVSKSLCGCIGSPDFIRLHTLRSQEKVIIVHELNREGVDNPLSCIYTLHSESQLSSSTYTSVAAVECPFTDFVIVGSSNGIICLSQYKNDVNHLWNPSTRRKLTIQDRPASCSDPSEGQFDQVFGFGYDPVMDDYKILRLIITEPLKKQAYDMYTMYTLKTGTWSEICGPAIPYSYRYHPISRQCLFKGTLHWVATGRLIDQSGASIFFSNMMTFDLSTDDFSSFALPQNGKGTSVTIIQGYLAVMSSDNDHNTWIWVRKEESSGNSYLWSMAFNINTTEINGAIQVLQLAANGELLLNYKLGILVYDPATHVQSRLEKFRGSKRVCAMQLCVESLGLLHMGTSC